MPRGRPQQNTAAEPGTLPTPRSRANNRAQAPFANRLVLNQWLLSQFNVKRFEDLAEHLRSEALKGLDVNNVHHFHHALTAGRNNGSSDQYNQLSFSRCRLAEFRSLGTPLLR